jgi:hypothetical protein
MARLPEERIYAWMGKAREKLEAGHPYLAKLILETAKDLADEYEYALPKEYFSLIGEIHEADLVRRFRLIEEMYEGDNNGYKNPLGDVALYLTYQSFRDCLVEAEEYVPLPKSLLEMKLEFKILYNCAPFYVELTGPDNIEAALMFNRAEMALERQPWYARADERLKRADSEP